jgi:hypothetical protein
MSIRVLVSSLCLVLTPALTQALVNVGNPGGNHAAPTGQDGQPTDPGFANARRLSGGTGIYLGNGWILTARHVLPRWVQVDSGMVESKDLIDETYTFKNAELKLFHLKETLDLPPVKIASSSPVVGTPVVMIGAGRASYDKIGYWQVDRATTPWTWTKLPGPEGANAGGILCARDQKMSWGTNRISALMPNPQMGKMLVVDFSDAPVERTAFEAQAVQFDSGGPVFSEGPDGWELTGIMVTVARLYPGQPGIVQPPNGGPLSVQSGFFGNLTLSVDLAPYRDEILKVTGLDDE